MIPRPFFLLVFSSLLTLVVSSPIDTPNDSEEPHPKKELPPIAHFALSLVWAALTAFQAKTILHILKLPLDPKSRDIFNFLSAAIFARGASYLLTATFALFVLPSLKGTPSQSSIIGTLADGATWAVDVLLLVAVILPNHEQSRTLESFKNISHETFDRVLLCGFAASAFALTAVSYINLGPLPSGYSLLRGILSIHLAIFAVLIVDCLAWMAILTRRQKRTGVKVPPLALMAPFISLFMVGIWTLRFLQLINPDTPVPFVSDFFSYLLLQPFIYSFIFLSLMGLQKDSEIQKPVAIGFVLTVVFVYVVAYIFSRIK